MCWVCHSAQQGSNNSPNNCNVSFVHNRHPVCPICLNGAHRLKGCFILLQSTVPAVCTNRSSKQGVDWMMVGWMTMDTENAIITTDTEKSDLFSSVISKSTKLLSFLRKSCSDCHEQCIKVSSLILSCLKRWGLFMLCLSNSTSSDFLHF